MKKFIVAAFWSSLSLFVSSAVAAEDASPFQRYEQAKLRIAYEGSAGNLLQQLAQRLNVGFITYELDTARAVSLPNSGEMTIKAITQRLESQLPDADIRFEKIGDRLFLVAAGKSAEPLAIGGGHGSEQFIGEVVFDTESVAPPIVADPNSENAKKLKAIVDVVTDQKLIAKYKKQPPQYRIASKEKLGLQNVRVSPLGTFLVFDKNVDVTALKVKGKFEDLARHDGLIAISHKDRPAPATIEISRADGKKLILEKIRTPNR